MRLDRRTFLGASAATAAACHARLQAQSSTVFRPEDFGARGDGSTNDTRAFAALSAAVNKRGSGTISLTPGRTYIVGAQSRGGPKFGWTGDSILDFENLSGPLHILGNGARLRAQPGLLFGTFEPASGQPVQRQMPNLERSELAFPYRGMIRVRRCSGPIEIRDVELDGNAARLRLGGKFGDKGWQVPASGILLADNRGTETIDNILSHHHGLDGATIAGTDQRSSRSRISRLVSRFNGRQGLSLTGGRGYDFADCEFSHTAKAGLHSPPGAGVDIEAEGHRLVRDVTFTRCKFVDNAGAGLTANNGDGADVRFTDCRFVGTTSWSAWPKRPGLSFTGCTFVGSIVHAFPDPDPARAAKFFYCTFTDDPRLSPTGQVYTASGPIASLGPSENVLFENCTFSLVGDGTLPSTRGAIYRDCTMSQRSSKPAAPGGRYLGTTTIRGPVNLAGSTIEGSVILNGRSLARDPVRGGGVS